MHAHAAAALINFCEGSGSDIIILYLDAIVERLLKLLNPPVDSGKQPKRYVQEQVITSLAMVADVSEKAFAKVRAEYHNLMHLCPPLGYIRSALCRNHALAFERVAKRKRVRIPQITTESNGMCRINWWVLFNPLRCAVPLMFDQRSLSAGKYSERILANCANSSCKSKVSFAPSLYGCQMVTALRIDSPVELDDTLLNSYLVASWAKICQALGPEFEPYLPVVMPPLLRAASAKADVSVIGLWRSGFSG